jgi:hypothetical protein
MSGLRVEKLICGPIQLPSKYTATLTGTSVMPLRCVACGGKHDGLADSAGLKLPGGMLL